MLGRTRWGRGEGGGLHAGWQGEGKGREGREGRAGWPPLTRGREGVEGELCGDPS